MNPLTTHEPGRVVTAAQPAPPWQRTLAATWIAQLLSIVGFSFVLPFMPFYIRELCGGTEGQVAVWSGVAITASGITFSIFSPIWGTLSDRYGRKIMVERAMFSGAVILALMGTVHSVYQLIALRILQGALTGTIVACTTLVSSVAPRDRLGSVLGLQQMAVVVGNSVGPWLGGMMADYWGYRVPFFASGVLLLLGGLIVAAGVYESFTAPAYDQGGNNGLNGLRQALGGRGLATLMAVFFFLSFSGSFVGPIFPLFVEKIAVGLRPATITGLLIGVTGLAAGVSAVAIGHISDRFGHKRLLVGCTFATGVLAALHGLTRNVTQLFGLRTLVGFSTGGTTPTMNAIIATSLPSGMYGRAYGLAQSASALGWAVGPLAGGVFASAAGLRWPFVIMGAMLVVTAGLVSYFVESDRVRS